jgi:hypothetical protein
MEAMIQNKDRWEVREENRKLNVKYANIRVRLKMPEQLDLSPLLELPEAKKKSLDIIVKQFLNDLQTQNCPIIRF